MVLSNFTVEVLIFFWFWLWVNFGSSFLLLTGCPAPNCGSQSLDLLLVTTIKLVIKLIRPLLKWHHRGFFSKLAPLLYFKRGLYWKLMTNRTWLWQSEWKQKNRTNWREIWIYAQRRSGLKLVVLPGISKKRINYIWPQLTGLK